MLWREWYALRRYLTKHFTANPPVDREWFEREHKDIARLMCYDIRPDWDECGAIEEQYEMVWGKEPWPKG